MRIYTRTGDDGSTGLVGGVRVGKDELRIECYGTVDELNAAIGLAHVAAGGVIRDRLAVVQNELFVIGSGLATPPGSPMEGSIPQLHGEAIPRLEREIDEVQGRLPELRNFILPGGCELAGRLHLARCVCRRAERLVVALGRAEVVNPITVTYLNRLSDWLFVMARGANQDAGVKDVLWVKTVVEEFGV